MTGMRGFPVDTKISRIKELVVNEMAKNISKKMKPGEEAKKSGNDQDDKWSTKSAEDDAVGGKPDIQHRRDHSYDNIAFSDRVGTGSNYRRNPAFPDFSKFARYFDHDGKPLGPTPFKPTIRAERHGLGYSSSFQHQRRRVHIKSRAYDDASDLFAEQSSRYGSAPHIDSDGFRISPDKDAYDGSRQSSSAYLRSRSAKPTTHRRYHSPEKFSEEDSDNESTGNVNGRSNNYEADSDRTDQPLPSFHRSRATTDPDNAQTSSSEDSQQKTEGRKTGPRPRRGLHAEGMTRTDRPSRAHPGMTLPVHRENIVTDTSNLHKNISQDDKKTRTGRKLPKTPTESSDSSFDKENASEFLGRTKEKSASFSNKPESNEPGFARRSNIDGQYPGEFSRQSRKCNTSGTDDEKQAPPSSSSYRTSRQQESTDTSNREHKVGGEYSRRPNTSANEYSPRSNLYSADQQSSAYRRNRSCADADSSTRSDTAHSSQSRRNVSGSHSNTKRNKKEFENLPDVMTPPTYEDGTPWGSGRTREQMRQDIRRSFSIRIKEQFKHYMKNPGNNSGSPKPSDSDSDTSGQSTNKETSSGQCNTDATNDWQLGIGQNAVEETNIFSNKREKQAVVEGVIPETEKSSRNWEEMISKARAKYSTQRVGRQPSTISEPVYGHGVRLKRHVTKSDFGIPTSIAINSKGGVVVAEYGHNCLEFYDESGKFVHRMDSLKPYSVAFNDKDQVIVGDRKSRAIRIFDEFGGDIAHWDLTSFNWICGIACLHNGQLAVYDRERCKIGVYSTPGEKILEFSSFGSNDSQVCMADFITIDSRNRLLIADSGNHCIKAFDSSTGAFIGKFGSRGNASGSLDWPKGICVDANDNIITTDMHNNRVCRFSSSGNFIDHLITGIENPYGVCYSRSTNSVGLTRYSLDGSSQYNVYSV